MTPSESSLRGRTHAAVAIELTFEQAGRPRRMAARPSRVDALYRERRALDWLRGLARATHTHNA